MEELTNLFNVKLDEKIDRFDGQDIRTIIPESSTQAVILNIDFFQDIPKEHMPIIFDDLIELILEYNNRRSINNWYTEAKNNNGKVISREGLTITFDKLKPSQKINKFLKAFKDYQVSIEELFDGCAFVDEKTYDNDIEAFEDFKDYYAPKEIGRNYINNKKIIEDLEKREFKIIPKNTFYGFEKASKNRLKTFLKDLRNKYNLKKALSEKQLLDLI